MGVAAAETGATGYVICRIAGKDTAEKLLGKFLVEGTGEAERIVPNPYGKIGGPAHQGKIKELTQELRSHGYDVRFEEYVKTPGGNKSARYGDILVTNPKTGEQWLVQVGKQTQAGDPISRESKAIQDLAGVYGINSF